MILTTKHGSEIIPNVESVTVLVPSSYTDGASQVGTFTNYFTRESSAGAVNHVVTTKAETITNLSPALIDLTDFPVIKHVEGQSGTGTVKFSTNGAGRRVSFQVGAGGTIDDVDYTTALIEGTLLDFCHSAIIGAASASGKDNEFYKLTSNGNPTAITSGGMYATVEPNPDCWAAGWDLTGVPIWCSATNAPNHGGAPITSRHFVEAEHYRSAVGTRWKWMLADGSIIERYSIGVNSRPSGTTQNETYRLNDIPGDIRVHALNAALPAGVKIYPIAGTWAQTLVATGNVRFGYDWQTSNSYQAPVAVVWLDQNRRAWFMGNYGNDCINETYSVAETIWNGTPIALPFYETAMGYSYLSGALETAVNATGRRKNGISGDSGSGWFVPLGGSDLALLSCFTGPVSGPYYSAARLNLLIGSADADAIARGNLVSPTGLTVTVAPDPTL